MNIFTKLLCTVVLASCAAGAMAQDTTLSVDVAEAGTLPSLISSEQKASVTSLTLTGKLNGTDIKFIRQMAGVDEYGQAVKGNSLQQLDMSAADIVAGGEPYFYTYTTTDSIVGEFFFATSTQLKTVKIPESTKRISWSAFSECGSLTEFAVPDKVSYIDQSVFSSCTSLEKVTFGTGLKTIDGYNFSGCTALTSIELPEGLEELNEFNFYQCEALQKVVLPSTLKSVGGYEFNGCTALTDVTIREGVEELKMSAFNGCTALKTIVLPGSMSTIAESAFSDCESLTDITLPGNLTVISESMFNGCSSLEHITIPESVTTIEWGAFCYDDHLKDITIPDAVTAIGDDAFFDCEAMTVANIGAGLSEMGEDVFKFCESLERINVSPDNKVYASEGGVLYDKAITKLIMLPPYNCEEYTTPSTVTSIADNAAITNMRLKRLTIGESVTSVGEEAFEKCDALEYIYIGSNVATLGDDAFFMCEAIKEIHSMTQKPLAIDGYMFWDVDKQACTLYVPSGTSDLYKAAEGWKEFVNIVETGTDGISATDMPQAASAIYNADGVKVFEGNTGDFRPQTRGLYIVKSGSKTTKQAF